MVKDKLLDKEPLAYTCLLNDLRNDCVAHSYLFCGQKNPLKKEAAYLLAQSIIENKKEFACEDCDTCLRIKDNNYLDVICIDGEDELIKKDDVEEILNQFNKTALEASGKKVYIISNINNATNKVLNMILKFMEEPSNDHTFGIFITDDVNTLLKTVVSRCKRVDFISNDYSEVKKRYLDNDYSLFDAYILSELNHDYINKDEIYDLSKEYVIKIIDAYEDPYYIESFMINEVYPLSEAKEIIELIIKIIIKILDDSIIKNDIGDEEYDSLLTTIEKDAPSILRIFLEAKEKLEKNNAIDHKLLFDSICCKIIESR